MHLQAQLLETRQEVHLGPGFQGQLTQQHTENPISKRKKWFPHEEHLVRSLLRIIGRSCCSLIEHIQHVQSPGFSLQSFLPQLPCWFEIVIDIQGVLIIRSQGCTAVSIILLGWPIEVMLNSENATGKREARVSKMMVQWENYIVCLTQEGCGLCRKLGECSLTRISGGWVKQRPRKII